MAAGRGAAGEVKRLHAMKRLCYLLHLFNPFKSPLNCFLCSPFRTLDAFVPEAVSSAVSALRWASARGHRRVVAALAERLGPEARDEQGGGVLVFDHFDHSNPLNPLNRSKSYQTMIDYNINV